jgi:hypothetical protein
VAAAAIGSRGKPRLEFALFSETLPAGSRQAELEHSCRLIFPSFVFMLSTFDESDYA